MLALALAVGFAVGLLAGGMWWYRIGWDEGHEDGVKSVTSRYAKSLQEFRDAMPKVERFRR